MCNYIREEYKRLIPVFSVCDGAFSKMCAAFGIIIVFLRSKLSGNVWLPFLLPIYIRHKGKRVRIVLSNKSDFYVLREIFVDKVYDASFCFKSASVQTIVDLGSNIGLSVVYFACEYPEAQIFAYEPDPRAFRVLTQNAEQFSNVQCSSAAVTDKDGTVDFFLGGKRSISSSTQKRNLPQEKILVQSKTLSSIMSEHNLSRVDILKMDVEGAEMRILEHMSESGILDAISCIVAEVHPNLMQQDSTDLENRVREILPGFICTIEQKGKGALLLLKAQCIIK